MNWEDAQHDVARLSKITGKNHRLLTAAEYEYAARAGRRQSIPGATTSATMPLRRLRQPPGSAWMSAGDCSHHRLRGGSGASVPDEIRSANRGRRATDSRLGIIGFRVGRTLDR